MSPALTREQSMQIAIRASNRVYCAMLTWDTIDPVNARFAIYDAIRSEIRIALGTQIPSDEAPPSHKAALALIEQGCLVSRALIEETAVIAVTEPIPQNDPDFVHPNTLLPHEIDGPMDPFTGFVFRITRKDDQKRALADSDLGDVISHSDPEIADRPTGAQDGKGAA